MNKVELRGITVHYGEHAVLEDFSLTVKAGRIIGIVGPSGCGKTTIVRSICGFINPEKGEVLIDGKLVYSKTGRVNVPPELRRIGVVFQDYAVWPHLSTYDNVSYPLKKRKTPKTQIPELVEEVLEQVNMIGYEKYLPSQLSGGQQQRVAIARALTTSSDFLIMDEPITNLDAKLREQMLVEIRMLQEKLGTTIIYITHDQEAAMQLCDEIVILNDNGSIAQIGTDEEIIKKPANRFVFQFIGVSNFLPTCIKGGKCYLSLDEEILLGDNIPQDYPKGKTKALLGVRPMDIVFDDNSPIKAKIVQATFLGNIYTYFISLGKEEYRVQRIATGETDDDKYREDLTVGVKFVNVKYFDMEERV